MSGKDRGPIENTNGAQFVSFQKSASNVNLSAGLAAAATAPVASPAPSAPTGSSTAGQSSDKPNVVAPQSLKTP
jgi:hypothetical protein